MYAGVNNERLKIRNCERWLQIEKYNQAFHITQECYQNHGINVFPEKVINFGNNLKTSINLINNVMAACNKEVQTFQVARFSMLLD